MWETSDPLHIASKFWNSLCNKMGTEIMYTHFSFNCHQNGEAVLLPKNCGRRWRNKEDYAVRKGRGFRQMHEQWLLKQCWHTTEQEETWGHRRAFHSCIWVAFFQRKVVWANQNQFGGELESRRPALRASTWARPRLLMSSDWAVITPQHAKCQTQAYGRCDYMFLKCKDTSANKTTWPHNHASANATNLTLGSLGNHSPKYWYSFNSETWTNASCFKPAYGLATF